MSPNFASVIPTMKVNITPNGIYNDASGTNFWSEQGPQACGAAGAIYQDAENFPAAYYLLFTSNSNSFVSTILGEAGVSAPPLVQGPPNAIGWGAPVVYVPILSTPARLPPVHRPR